MPPVGGGIVPPVGGVVVPPEGGVVVPPGGSVPPEGSPGVTGVALSQAASAATRNRSVRRVIRMRVGSDLSI